MSIVTVELALAPEPKLFAQTSCMVPGCRRHTARYGNSDVEWLCVDHWRLVDPALKRFRTKLVRRYIRKGELTQEPLYWRAHSRRARRMLTSIWRRMKRQAIERAAGLN